MENVVLVIHLLLALALIGVVLLQRSEGGGLGIGGGSGVMTGRGAATALGRATWWIAGAFIVTSLALTIIAARNSASGSVVDRLTDAPAEAATPALPDLGGSLLPPGDGSAPLVPVPAPAATPEAAPDAATEAPAQTTPETTPAPEPTPAPAAEGAEAPASGG
ncbi:MAG: preprotein translocase subunit SecG [Rubellimicrobium sp.]|nr:preprotein translocase subunit SecG [Rubellimicrobium sp.]